MASKHKFDHNIEFFEVDYRGTAGPDPWLDHLFENLDIRFFASSVFHQEIMLSKTPIFFELLKSTESQTPSLNKRTWPFTKVISANCQNRTSFENLFDLLT